MRLDLDGLDGVLHRPRAIAGRVRVPSTLPPSLRVQASPPPEPPPVGAPAWGPLVFAGAVVTLLTLVVVGAGALIALWPAPPVTAAVIPGPPPAAAPAIAQVAPPVAAPPEIAAVAAEGTAPPTRAPDPPLAPVAFMFDRADAPELPDALVRAARACAGTFELVGHTCALGAPETNHLIGLARANAVRDALIAAGVPAAGLSTRSAGADQPIAPQSTPEGRRANRRVEANCMQPSESP